MRSERPRRLRRDGLRELVSETSLRAEDLIAPVFVDATTDGPREIPSMPGQVRIPPTDIVDRCEAIAETGIQGILLFGIPSAKDAEGSRASAEDGVVQRALRRLDGTTDLTIMTDVCLCEYTDHGHCGILAPRARTDVEGLTVANDPTLDRLAEIAVSHAEAGADLVAPSAMMDGMVGAIREGLDGAGYEDVPIISYAVKYESAFYGPFRDAADGAPAFGDRRHYQMDPANRREARYEASLDVEEAADLLMVKPGLAYLDVLADLRERFDRPLVAYNVSGEYAMVSAAAERGWLDRGAAAEECLLAMKRAGADLIVTYFAEEVAARW